MGRSCGSGCDGCRFRGLRHLLDLLHGGCCRIGCDLRIIGLVHMHDADNTSDTCRRTRKHREIPHCNAERLLRNSDRRRTVLPQRHGCMQNRTADCSVLLCRIVFIEHFFDIIRSHIAKRIHKFDRFQMNPSSFKKWFSFFRVRISEIFTALLLI